MKNRKLLSILLSLILVFSMATAFTSLVYADEDCSNGDTLESSPVGAVPVVTPDKVTVNGVTLSPGEYYDGSSSPLTTTTKSKYAYFRIDGSGESTLVLHELSLSDVSGSSAITVNNATNSPNTLYIELEGTNSIAMASSNTNAAIKANSCDLYISGNDSTGKLQVTSNQGTYGEMLRDAKPVYCITAGSFTLTSGTLKLKAGTGNYFQYSPHSFEGDAAINTVSGDITICGGTLQIDKAAAGINSSRNIYFNGGNTIIGDSSSPSSIACIAVNAPSGSTIINGGDLTIKGSAYYGLKANASVFMKNGMLSISKVKDTAISANSYDINISGGETFISNVGCAISTINKDINISGGEISIDNITNDAIYAFGGNINISGGDISIGDSAKTSPDIHANAIVSDGNTTIDAGNISISNVDYTGIVVYGEMKINGGKVDITKSWKGIGVVGSFELNDAEINMEDISVYGIDTTGNIAITDSKITLIDVLGGGIYSQSGKTDIINSKINIDGADFGITSKYSISIENSTGKITAYTNAISGNSGITVKNSNFEVLSESKEANYKAFSPTVSIEGNPAVYAGTTKADAKRVSADSELGTYQYVHIYNGSSVLLSKISSAFTNLITAINNLNTKFLNNSSIWKLLVSIFSK